MSTKPKNQNAFPPAWVPALNYEAILEEFGVPYARDPDFPVKKVDYVASGKNTAHPGVALIQSNLENLRTGMMQGTLQLPYVTLYQPPGSRLARTIDGLHRVTVVREYSFATVGAYLITVELADDVIRRIGHKLNTRTGTPTTRADLLAEAADQAMRKQLDPHSQEDVETLHDIARGLNLVADDPKTDGDTMRVLTNNLIARWLKFQMTPHGAIHVPDADRLPQETLVALFYMVESLPAIQGVARAILGMAEGRRKPTAAQARPVIEAAVEVRHRGETAMIEAAVKMAAIIKAAQLEEETHGKGKVNRASKFKYETTRYLNKLSDLHEKRLGLIDVLEVPADRQAVLDKMLEITRLLRTLTQDA